MMGKSARAIGAATQPRRKAIVMTCHWVTLGKRPFLFAQLGRRTNQTDYRIELRRTCASLVSNGAFYGDGQLF